MKLRKPEPALEPRVERELEALEAALAGRAVEPELAEVAAFATELRAARPTPTEEFAARLDARAGEGFSGAEGGRGRAASLRARIRSAPLRRRLMPLGATALAAVVVATAIVASRDDGGGGETGALYGQEAPEASPPSSPGGGATPAPAAAAKTGQTQEALRAGGAVAAGDLAARSRPGTGPFASGQRHRFKETSAQLTLGTDAGHVQQVADDIFGVVGRYDGIVLSSSISDGPEGEAGATFDLLVPSTRLSDALTDLSRIAEVRSRQESSRDITAPVVTVGERLRDANAEVQGLLKQLANADSDEERAAVEQQLRFQRQRVAALRASLASLHRRANLSRVSLQVVTGESATFPGGGGKWTIGDALRDSGRILAVAAGVTLVGLAVLAPIALLALLAWLARRGWVRASRERALG
jgi:hypothetical protein